MFYSVGESIHNAISLLYTKAVWGKDIRMIRCPFRARNKKYIKLGKNFSCGFSCRMTAGNRERSIVIGDNCTMGDYCQIEGSGGVLIGNNVLLGSKVFISSNSHGVYSDKNRSEHSSPYMPPEKRPIVEKSVIIGDNVWIGNGASILMGVCVGSGAVIGAGSVVTKDVPSNTIVAGIPAKTLKKYNENTKKWEVQDSNL